MLSCSRFAAIKNNSKFSIVEANNSTFVIPNSPTPTDLLKQEHGYRQEIRTASQTTGPC